MGDIVCDASRKDNGRAIWMCTDMESEGIDGFIGHAEEE